MDRLQLNIMWQKINSSVKKKKNRQQEEEKKGAGRTPKSAK